MAMRWISMFVVVVVAVIVIFVAIVIVDITSESLMPWLLLK